MAITGKDLAELARGEDAELYVVVDEVVRQSSRAGRPQFCLWVRDRSSGARIIVQADDEACGIARTSVPGRVMKVVVGVTATVNGIELAGRELRDARDDDRFDRDRVFGPLIEHARAVAIGAVGFDIETVARYRPEELPDRERAKLERRALDTARRDTGAESPDQTALADATNKVLALHPLTTQVVSVAFYSLEAKASLALVVGSNFGDSSDVAQLQESDLLRTFWGVARRADIIVGFNSRNFDLPVLAARSAVLGVRGAFSLDPRRTPGARHVDVSDMLGGRGSRASLELSAFAFGITAKSASHGGDVARLVRENRLRELEKYNIEDARATAELYDHMRAAGLDRG